MFDINLGALRHRRRSRRRPSPPKIASDAPSSFFRRRFHRRTPNASSLRRFKIPPKQTLSRASSEPLLCSARLHVSPSLGRKDEPSLFLPASHTCSDVVLPSLPSFVFLSDHFNDGAKVVVSVAVEGSPGPVKAMVRLGASVEEAIGVIVEQYGREGRSPRIGIEDAAGFELHHSHFSLQSLSKCEKIGQVGGRSFYLRTSSGRSESTNPTAGSSKMSIVKDSSCPVPFDFFISFIISKMRKFGRRTKKFWRMVACISCS